MEMDSAKWRESTLQNGANQEPAPHRTEEQRFSTRNKVVALSKQSLWNFHAGRANNQHIAWEIIRRLEAPGILKIQHYPS